ncbi:MAG TPA: ECF transporter S component [Geobacterales bacterium]|nr:ECF transporter S component [Geobacterales bacterium]
MNRARFVAYTAICAALYAVSIVIFAFIPTPWGVGHFRPTVIIPQFFAFLGGPWVAAIGAAIGTFLGDVFGLYPAGLSNPLLSLIAGVPANFFGFLLFGYLIKRFNTWQDFIWVSLVSLFIGNLIAGMAVAFSLGIVFNPSVGYTTTYRLYTGMGLTLFWLVTMLPFTYGITPLLVRYIFPVAPYAVVMKGGSFSGSRIAAIIVGVLLLAVAFAVVFPFSTIFDNSFHSINVSISALEFGIFVFIAGLVAIVIASL